MSANKPKKPHLGRGLESLLGSINSMISSDQQEQPASSNFPPDKELESQLANLPLERIRPNPYQPRTTWDQQELAALAESIKTAGLLQPIIVRQVGQDYEVIAGERRLRAARLAGLENIPAMVRSASDEQMLELALVENIHRTDLNPIERARAYQNYVDTFQLTQADAAVRLGEDRTAISNYIRLLSLPQDIKQMLMEGSLSMGHARAILGLPTDDLRRKLANRALAGRLSVREVEHLVRRYTQSALQKKTPSAQKSAHILDMEKKLQSILGTKVRIDQKKRGHRGRIIIEYYSLDDFDRLAEKMGMEQSSEL